MMYNFLHVTVGVENDLQLLEMVDLEGGELYSLHKEPSIVKIIELDWNG